MHQFRQVDRAKDSASLRLTELVTIQDNPPSFMVLEFPGSLRLLKMFSNKAARSADLETYSSSVR